MLRWLTTVSCSRRPRRGVVLAAFLSAALVAVPLAAGLASGAAAVRPAGSPPGSVRGDTFLNGVSTPSAQSAWAVGTTVRHGYRGMVQHWDGSSWTTVLTYAPPGTIGTELMGVAAASDDDVWVVGDSADGSGDPRATVLHWDGSSWTALRRGTGGPGWTSQLLGVSEVSPSDVWAVGFYYPRHSHHALPLVLHWDGTALARVAVPPPQAQSDFEAVSASSGSDVWAVGSSWRGLSSKSFSEHYDGHSWQQIAVPKGIDLVGVYASAPGRAWAVGSTVKAGPQVLHYADGAWSQVRLPPADSAAELDAVGGSSDGDVWAVGDDQSGGSRSTLTLHWDGHDWTRVSSPSRGQFAAFNGVAATGPRNAWAVGGHAVGGGSDQAPVHELWNGRRWLVR